MEETSSSLEEKKTELEEIKVDTAIIRAEKFRDKAIGEEPAETPPTNTLADTLVEKVVIPIVQKNLSNEDSRKDTVAEAAIKLATKAVEKGKDSGSPGKPGNTITDIVSALSSFKDLIKDDSTKNQLEKVTEQLKELKERKPEPSKALGKEYTEFLDFYDKMQERMKPTGTGSTDAHYEFEKWKVENERKTVMQDRAFNLRVRQQDKEHDARLAELGIQKERNELFMSGLKRLGTAIGAELSEEDDYEEEKKPAPAKGRKQLIQEICSVCQTQVLIPPEAQVKGKEITCSKCDSVYTWE